MSLQKENPAGGRGLPNTDSLTGGINSEDRRLTRSLQVALLTRRCAISAAMAAIVAPILFGEGSR